jgi:hypothetical protein
MQQATDLLAIALYLDYKYYVGPPSLYRDGAIARQSGCERRVNQDETQRPSVLMIGAGCADGKLFD